MNRILAIAVAGILAVMAGTAVAKDFKAGDIVVSDVWARASASKMMKAGAAFAMLTTTGNEMDRLVAASAPVSERTELHTHLMENGIMKMRQVQAIEVHPGEPTMLQPGGLHIMFINLRAPLEEGQQIPVTLTFEKAGQVVVTATVMGPGAKGPGDMKGMSHMGHGS